MQYMDKRISFFFSLNIYVCLVAVAFFEMVMQCWKLHFLSMNFYFSIEMTWFFHDSLNYCSNISCFSMIVWTLRTLITFKHALIPIVCLTAINAACHNKLYGYTNISHRNKQLRMVTNHKKKAGWQFIRLWAVVQ